MKITQEQYDKIKHKLPKQRGNVTVENIDFINALLYICENGCKWRRLPKEYGKWHPIYKRFQRWVEAGIITSLLKEMCDQKLLDGEATVRLMDSFTVPVHPDACGALKKRCASNRTLQWRIDYKNSHDGYKCPNCCRIYPKRGATPRCSPGQTCHGHGGQTSE